MPFFADGPQAGTAVFDPRVDERGAPPVDMGAAAADPADPSGNGGPDQQGEAQLFEGVLAGLRQLLAGGSLSQSSTLLLSKAETLLQQIKAAEEKDAGQQKMTPELLRRAYGG